MRFAAFLPVALALCACERPAPEPPAPEARPEPVVVYASFEDENYLPSLFAAFTRDTGIPVTVRHRPEKQIVDEVIGKGGSPPADVLLTRSVHGIWRAADEGALRPLQSQEIARIVPGWLRDPDGYWTAIGFSPVRVVCNADRPEDCDGVEAYADLGKPEVQGGLCLSASTLAVNRTLVAGLIADHGVRPAELIVRSWIANLALPPFESEAALLQALEAGTCRLAVVSSLAFDEFNRPTAAAIWPQPGYFDVVAVGINRHARNPDAARRLVEWLAAAGLPFPAPEGMRNANVFALHEADAIKLAERARWY